MMFGVILSAPRKEKKMPRRTLRLLMTRADMTGAVATLTRHTGPRSIDLAGCRAAASLPAALCCAGIPRMEKAAAAAGTFLL